MSGQGQNLLKAPRPVDGCCTSSFWHLLRRHNSSYAAAIAENRIS
jgi:hypothetical protein